MIVRTLEFWTLWFTFFLNTQAITYINSMYKAYGQTFINDDHFLSLVGAIAAIFNATGRKVEKKSNLSKFFSLDVIEMDEYWNSANLTNPIFFIGSSGGTSATSLATRPA